MPNQPNVFFHGTDANTARDLASRAKPLDVDRGGGEFGRGFYVAFSAPLVVRFAIGRFGVMKARALQLTVQSAALTSLSTSTLSDKEAKKLRQKLRNAGTTKTHVLGADLVYGPIEGSPGDIQGKFESADAESALNDSEVTQLGLVR